MQVFDFDNCGEIVRSLIKQFKGWYRESSNGKGFHAILLDKQDTYDILGPYADEKFGEKIFFNNKGNKKASAWIKIGDHNEPFPYKSEHIFLFNIGRVFMICAKDDGHVIQNFIDEYASVTDNVYISEHSATILVDNWHGYVYKTDYGSSPGRRTFDMYLYQV